MAERLVAQNSATLRAYVSRFLTRESRLRAPLVAALKRLSEKKLDAVIFGGAIRDLMVHGPATEPRDVDIVVDGASVNELRAIFSDVFVRKTRFGGLSLNVKGWTIDIWPLLETWGLREFRIGSGDFEALTRTTFLNVEAVIVDLTPFRNTGRRVYASGFFEAIQSRTLDINLRENPFPELSAIRALVTASKLRFQLSVKLAKYIVQQTSQTPLEQFVQIQLNHYGFARLDVEMIHRWSKSIKAQVATQPVVRLPFEDAVQRKLWHEREDLDPCIRHVADKEIRDRVNKGSSVPKRGADQPFSQSLIDFHSHLQNPEDNSFSFPTEQTR